jgi:two-component system, NtrC family, sensor kinase
MKKYSSLRRKLATLMAGGSVVAAVIAAAGFSWLDLHRFWQHTDAEVAAIAGVIADQVGPAITFRDQKAANELLGSLRADTGMHDAMLYDAQGNCFASFHRLSASGCPPRPRDGRRLDGDALVLTRAVTAGDERLGTLVLADEIPSMGAVLKQYLGGAALIMALSLVVAAVVAVVLQARVSTPILAMALVAERIAETQNFADRVSVTSSDELGVLANSFNAMLEEIGRCNAELAKRTEELQEEVFAKERAHAELAEAQQHLIELSRLSGMAEVATGVLHNVGNVLNSVNVSTTIVAGKIRELRTDKLVSALDLLQPHEKNVADFLTNDPKGQRVMPYLSKVAKHLQAEREASLQELELLRDHVSHIKQIVAAQQNYAKVSGVTEEMLLPDLVTDAFRIIEPSLERHQIRFERDFEDLPAITVDKHKVIQILLNLFRNAKEAIKESDNQPRVVRVTIRRHESGCARIQVTDSGIGLTRENLTRIFAHGFTTKRNGHGFGLHSGALDAKQMGGALWAESAGAGRGATFVLELPMAQAEKRDAA